jgi:hypothetical protein
MSKRTLVQSVTSLHHPKPTPESGTCRPYVVRVVSYTWVALDSSGTGRALTLPLTTHRHAATHYPSSRLPQMSAPSPDTSKLRSPSNLRERKEADLESKEVSKPETRQVGVFTATLK